MACTGTESSLFACNITTLGLPRTAQCDHAYLLYVSCLDSTPLAGTYVLCVYLLCVYVLCVYVLCVYVLCVYVLCVYVLCVYVLCVYVLCVYCMQWFNVMLGYVIRNILL